jgi:membrane protein
VSTTTGREGADDEAGPARGAGAAHVTASREASGGGAHTERDGDGRFEIEPRPTGFAGLVARVKALLAWWQGTRPARANARFGAHGGGVLTGGIAYATLFSVVAGLTIGWTVFMAVLGSNTELRAGVISAINQALPGLVATDDSSDGLDLDNLRLTGGLTFAGIVAIVVLLVSALSAMAAMRTGVREMFESDSGPGAEPAENAVLAKLRELGGFVGMATAILVSALASLGLTSAVRWALSAAGWAAGTEVVVTVLGYLVTAVIDAATFVLVVVVLAGQRPPRPDLLGGAAIAAVGLGVVRYLGASVIAGSATKNPLLASFAVIVTLLVWVNLIARIVLLAAAWTADPPAPAQKSAERSAGSVTET